MSRAYAWKNGIRVTWLNDGALGSECIASVTPALARVQPEVSTLPGKRANASPLPAIMLQVIPRRHFHLVL